MVVLAAAAGSENTRDGIARLRKAFLKHSSGSCITNLISSMLTCVHVCVCDVKVQVHVCACKSVCVCMCVHMHIGMV